MLALIRTVSIPWSCGPRMTGSTVTASAVIHERLRVGASLAVGGNWVGGENRFGYWLEPRQWSAGAAADSWNVVEYLSLPPTRHDLTQGQKPEGRLKWG